MSPEEFKEQNGVEGEDPKDLESSGANQPESETDLRAAMRAAESAVDTSSPVPAKNIDELDNKVIQSREEAQKLDREFKETLDRVDILKKLPVLTPEQKAEQTFLLEKLSGWFEKSPKKEEKRKPRGFKAQIQIMSGIMEGFKRKQQNVILGELIDLDEKDLKNNLEETEKEINEARKELGMQFIFLGDYERKHEEASKKSDDIIKHIPNADVREDEQVKSKKDLHDALDYEQKMAMYFNLTQDKAWGLFDHYLDLVRKYDQTEAFLNGKFPDFLTRSDYEDHFRDQIDIYKDFGYNPDLAKLDKLGMVFDLADLRVESRKRELAKEIKKIKYELYKIQQDYYRLGRLDGLRQQFETLDKGYHFIDETMQTEKSESQESYQKDKAQVAEMFDEHLKKMEEGEYSNVLNALYKKYLTKRKELAELGGEVADLSETDYDEKFFKTAVEEGFKNVTGQKRAVKSNKPDKELKKLKPEKKTEETKKDEGGGGVYF